jgi:DNA gyrase subunit A
VKEFTDQAPGHGHPQRGVVKKTNLSDYRNYRKGGIIGINIDEGDASSVVKLTTGDDELS